MTRKRPMCDAVKRNGQPCGNRAAWFVTFREPPVAGSLRRQILARRCSAHSENVASYPDGATQITVRGAWNVVILDTRSAEEPTP